MISGLISPRTDRRPGERASMDAAADARQRVVHELRGPVRPRAKLSTGDGLAVTVDGQEDWMARYRMALWMTLLAIGAVVLAIIVLQQTGIMFAG